MSQRLVSKKSDHVTVGKGQTTIRMPGLLASDSNIGAVETLFDEENELGNNVNVHELSYSKIESPQSVKCLQAKHEQYNMVCTPENFNQLRKFWEAKCGDKSAGSAGQTVKINGKNSMELESETRIMGTIEENEVHDSLIDVFSKRHKRRIQYVSTPVKDHQLASNYPSLVQNIASSAKKNSFKLDETSVVSERQTEECVNDKVNGNNRLRHCVGDEIKSLNELDESASCLPSSIRIVFDHTSSENLSSFIDVDLMPSPECEINKNSGEKKSGSSLCNTPQSLGKGCIFQRKLFDSSELTPFSLTPSSDCAKKGFGRKRHLMSLDSSKYSHLFSPEPGYGPGQKKMDKNVVKESVVECVSETKGFKCANLKTNETHMFDVNGEHSSCMDEVNGHDSRKELVSEDSFFDITVLNSGKDSTFIDISNISAILNSRCDSANSTKLDLDDMVSPEVFGFSSGMDKNRKAVSTDTSITDTSLNESSCFHSDVASHVRDVIENVIPVLNEMSENEKDDVTGELVNDNAVNESEKFRTDKNTCDDIRYGDESLLFCAEHETDLYSPDTDDNYLYFNESNYSSRNEERGFFVDLSSTYSDYESSAGPLDILVSPSLLPVARNQTITVVTDNIEYVPQEDVTSLDVPPAYLNLFEVSKNLKCPFVSVNTASRKSDLYSPLYVDNGVEIDKNTCIMASSLKSIGTESSQSVSDPQVVQKHVTCSSPTFDDFSDDSSSDFGSYPPRSKRQKKNNTEFEYPEVTKSTSVSDSVDAYVGFLSGPGSALKPLIKFELNESCFHDEEYPESLNTSSAYCKSFSFWSGSSTSLDTCNTWSHSSDFEEYLELDQTFPVNTQFAIRTENEVPINGSFDKPGNFSDLKFLNGTQIETEKLSDVYKYKAPSVDLYNNSCSIEPTDNRMGGHAPKNEVSAVHTNDVSCCQVPIDLSMNFGVSLSNVQNPESEQNISAGYVSLAEQTVHNNANESDKAFSNVHAPHVAVLENDYAQVWTEINIGNVAYSDEPSFNSIQYAPDCYNNAIAGMPHFLEHSVHLLPNQMVQSSVYSNFKSSAESSFNPIFNAYPCSVSSTHLSSVLSINNNNNNNQSMIFHPVQQTVDDGMPLSYIAGLTASLYANQSVVSNEVTQSVDGKYMSSDIDHSIMSVNQIKQSDCQYQPCPTAAQPNRNNKDKILSSKVNGTATVNKDTNRKQGCSLMKYLETEIRNKLMSKKNAGSNVSRDKDTFILNEGLKDVRPYIISGWISSTYLMAIAKKADLVNEMLANPLNEKSEVFDWIIENCRSNTPAIFARDLFFRLFTLGELENLNLIKLARTKRFKALKKSVQRLFPGRVTSACWDGCLRLIKSSVSILFKHRVRQVQDFLAIHASYLM